MQNVCFNILNVFCPCKIVYACHMFLYLRLPLLFIKNKQITKEEKKKQTKTKTKTKDILVRYLHWWCLFFSLSLSCLNYNTLILLKKQHMCYIFLRFGAVKSDSTHHFFGNACTKSGPLRFPQFSGCWLILSVWWFMSFAFPFGRLLGVR